MFKKCIGNAPLFITLENVGIKDNLLCEEILVKILDCHVHKLRIKELAFVKVFCRNKEVEQATWKVKESIKYKYPDIISPHGDNISIKDLLSIEIHSNFHV